MSMPPLLEVSGLWAAAIHGQRASMLLRDVNIEIARGEVHGIVGESGAGKTMLGRAILGVLPPAIQVLNGTIRFGARDLLALNAHEKRGLLGRELAMIPQNPMTGFNPVRKIGAQMTDGLRLHTSLRKAAALDRAKEMLATVQIRNPARVVDQYPFELSGGMRQRILIAMAFANNPRLIVADEPTTALDVTIQREILRLIRKLQLEFGTAVAFVTHDLAVVAKICDRCTVMHTGRVLESASTATLFGAASHPYTRALLRATPRYDQPDDALVPIPPELNERLAAEARAMDAAHAA